MGTNTIKLHRVLRRPADANETAMAWRIALERQGGPVALALTRQKVPTFDRSVVEPAEGGGSAFRFTLPLDS